MLRDIDLNEISDGRLYTANDMVKADCMGCQGCASCCQVQRIKSQIRFLDRANERDYIEIGKKIYEKFKAGEVADLEYIALCESIEKREEEAVQCQEEIRKIQEV